MAVRMFPDIFQFMPAGTYSNIEIRINFSDSSVDVLVKLFLRKRLLSPSSRSRRDFLKLLV